MMMTFTPWCIFRRCESHHLLVELLQHLQIIGQPGSLAVTDGCVLPVGTLRLPRRNCVAPRSDMAKVSFFTPLRFVRSDKSGMRLPRLASLGSQ